MPGCWLIFTDLEGMVLWASSSFFFIAKVLSVHIYCGSFSHFLIDTYIPSLCNHNAAVNNRMWAYFLLLEVYL